MKTCEMNLQKVYLKPGEIYIGKKPTLVSTVLGSCVSVTMFSRRLGIGAISHALFPLCRNTVSCDIDINECFKYVDCSTLYMINKFREYGVKTDEIEVKMFGGASVMVNNDIKDDMKSVGTMNVEMAVNLLETKNLYITGSNVGQTWGRKIIFHTHTGEVLLKQLKSSAERTNPNSMI